MRSKRNINTKFEANSYSGSREEVNNGILHSDIHSNTL